MKVFIKLTKVFHPEKVKSFLIGENSLIGSDVFQEDQKL